ncbi:V-type proton ATPase subunit H-like [Corticium candelabrum]|uniref:V-type proton ATPase subunit H-like n=1 Tax=Corticium candelabrum TaxID=121492 RepID=UPI002E337513|nr:V-type proton ATPase subunit H-like [Corticium candelabrum]
MYYQRVESHDVEVGKQNEIVVSSIANQALARMEKLRGRRINWESYYTTGMIDEEEYHFIQEYSTRPSDGRNSIIINQPSQCVRTFLNVPQKIRTDDTVQFVLTLLYDLLMEDKERVAIFHKYAEDNEVPVYQSLQSLLERPSPFTYSVASHTMAVLLSTSSKPMADDDLKYYLNFIREQLKNPNAEYLHSIIASLQLLLRVNHYRVSFLNHHCVEGLIKLLGTPRLNFQLQYQLIFCIWLLAFNPQIAGILNKYGVIVLLADILRQSIKIKVQRITVAALRNLAEKPENPTENCQVMIQQRVPQMLRVLVGKNWEDEEIEGDIEFLQETLTNSLQDLSSFDEYVTEIRSGRLEWSPAHKSDKFWRENVMKFNERSHELLKQLAQLLEARDAPTLAITVHDFGQYVRFYPRGKDYIESEGVKQRIMHLLQHEDSSVKYEALVAVQKMMVQNWEYLGKQLQAA